MPQQTRPANTCRERDALECVTRNVGQPVVSRQAAIDEGGAGVEQMLNRAIVFERIGDKQTGFRLHRRSETTAIVGGELFFTGRHGSDLVECSHASVKCSTKAADR